jgi:hypothetical protein
VQALYSIAALARAGNVDAHLLRRVLRANQLELLRNGRTLYVPLSEIQRKIPALWESLRAAEELRCVEAAAAAGQAGARRRRASSQV